MHALLTTKHIACMKNHFLFCCSIAFIKFLRRNLREHQQPVSKTQITKAEVQYTKRARDCSIDEIARRKIKLRNGVEKTSISTEGRGTLTRPRRTHCRCASFCCGPFLHPDSCSSHTCQSTHVSTRVIPTHREDGARARKTTRTCPFSDPPATSPTMRFVIDQQKQRNGASSCNML